MYLTRELMYTSIDDIENELTIMQLSDSFFPTGIFATSNGLEFLFYEKNVRNVHDVLDLVVINLKQQIGPTDCVILGNVIDSAKKGEINRIIEADNMLYASKLVRDIREASTRSGIQVVRCVSEFVRDSTLLRFRDSLIEKKTHGTFPVALAVCCNALNIKKENGMIIMMYGFTVGMVGAALRLGIIQHFEGQKIIHSVKPVISEIVREYSKVNSLEKIWQFAPQMDIIQMSHEKMDSKMFIT